MSLGGGRGPEKTTYGEGMEIDGRKGDGGEERGQWRAEQILVLLLFPVTSQFPLINELSNKSDSCP